MMSAPASAQQTGPSSAATPTIRLGPVGISPTISVTNVGVDSNVYATAEDPLQDFTATVTPGLRYWIPIQRVQFSGTSTFSFVYFDKAVEQRAFNVLHEGRVVVSGNRLSPRVFGGYGRVRGRPSLEIEAFVQEWTQRFGVGADVRLGSRQGLLIEAQQLWSRFEDELFLDENLQTELNRENRSVRAAWQLSLTPLTTFVVSVDAARDRFEFSPERDAEIVTVVSGVDLEPAALITGTASIGFRRFNALSPGIPDFTGPVWNVGVSYTLKGRTRFALTGQRTTEYSIDSQQSYYVATGGGLTVTQAVGGGWDVLAGVTRDRLAYRGTTGPTASESASRVDDVDSAKTGFGRRVGDGARIGLDVSYTERRSKIQQRGYDGWRAGVSFLYGS